MVHITNSKLTTVLRKNSDLKIIRTFSKIMEREVEVKNELKIIMKCNKGYC